MDKRFERLYILQIEEGEKYRLEQLCDDYHINTNGTIEGAVDFHVIWGIGGCGLIYLSQVMALRGIDFKSLDELEEYLEKFNEQN